jgi:hypothetical protein
MSTIMNPSEGEGEGLAEPKCNELSRRAWEIEEVEPWTEPVDGRLLLNELEEIVRRHVVLPKWAAETVALWILHTYGFELRDVSTYLGVESPEKRCGKTTLLSVLSELANRAVALANISSPAVYRSIEEKRPTLLIDEADTFLQGNDQLRGILNSGYTRKTAFVVRVAAQKRVDGSSLIVDGHSKGSRLERFSCWCPKVMAAIGHLPETLADRCIVIRMQRKTRGEQCEKLRNLDGSILRRKCARFVLDNSTTIWRGRPSIPADLNDRAADVWEPLFALAEIAGGEWPEKARAASLGLTGLAQESSLPVVLMKEIQTCFEASKVDRLFSRTLVLWLVQCKNSPWGNAEGGKEITELWLSQRLRPYGVRPRTVWLMGESAKGYSLEDFGKVFRRYLPGGS